jgi:PAS domain S-box-containing protein
MTVSSYIHLVATPIFIVLAVFAIARNPRSMLNWFCAATLLSLSIYAFADIFLPMRPLIPLAQARWFCKIRDTGVYLFPGFWLLFAMALAGRRRALRSWWTYVPLAFFMVGLNVAQWTGHGGIGCKASPLAWTHDLIPGFWLYLGYLLSTVVIGLGLIARFWLRAHEPRQRRQARLIFVTGLISLVLSAGNDLILIAVVPRYATLLAPSLTLVLAVGLIISITRYGFLPFTPQVAADQILATMLDPLLLLNPDGMIATTNQATQDLLGYSRNELAGQSAGTIFARPGEFAAVLQTVLDAGQVNGVELSCKARLGGEVPALISARTMRSEGLVLGSVWVLRDITQLKKAQEEIRAKSERLEVLNETLNGEQTRLLELTRQLTHANEELKVLSEAKSDFVAAASHDLRTPLTTIIEGISLTEDGTLGPVNEGQRKFLGYAHEDAERLSELISNLLDVRKIEQGRMESCPTDIVMAQVLPRIAAPYVTFARGKGISLEVSVPAGLPCAYCDAGHLHRVMTNLLSNAVKFTRSGGRIAVRAESGRPGGQPGACGGREEGELETELAAGARQVDDGERIIVSVADTGLGIPADQQHRIFGRFEQVRRGGPEVLTGTGLGLSLCKQLVEMNKGTIGFSSVENKGSTFFFSLPVGQPRGQAIS